MLSLFSSLQKLVFPPKNQEKQEVDAAEGCWGKSQAGEFDFQGRTNSEDKKSEQSKA